MESSEDRIKDLENEVPSLPSGYISNLEYLFTVMPTEEWRKDPEILESLTPCSPEIRKKFKK